MPVYSFIRFSTFKTSIIICSDVLCLLSILKEYRFRFGRKNWKVWSPNSLKGFSCKSFFRSLIDPSPVGESVSQLFGGLGSLGKFIFLLGKFYMAVLIRWVSLQVGYPS